MTAQDETYHGWSNDEMWTVNTWLTNDPEASRALDTIDDDVVGTVNTWWTDHPGWWFFLNPPLLLTPDGHPVPEVVVALLSRQPQSPRTRC